MARKLELGSAFGGAAAAATSVAASLCCVGPLALTLLGVNGMILAAGIKPYRGYLLGASLLFLGLAFWVGWTIMTIQVEPEPPIEAPSAPGDEPDTARQGSA